MFCHKCGSKAPEGSVFCSKCGARLSADDAAPQPDASETMRQTGSSPSAQSPKQINRRRLFISCASVLMIILVISIAVGKGKDKQTSSPAPSADESLPETASDAGEGAESAQESMTTGEVLYNGQPVTVILGCTSEELYERYGAPTGGTPVDGSLLFGGTEYYAYDGISFWLDSQGTVTYINVSPKALKMNGTALNRNRDSILQLFGSPVYEGEIPEDESGEGFGGCYAMEYFMKDNTVLFTVELPDADGIANNVTIAWCDDGPGEEDYAGWDGQEPAFNRWDYFTGITYMDLLRYPDNHYGNKLYFSAQVVVEVLEPRLYLVKGDDFSVNDGKYLIIDDRYGTGANAVKGDRVAVYGSFSQLTNVSFTDGRNEQVPIVAVDRFIVNTLPPNDLDDFAQALVTAMNLSPYTFGTGSQYLSGSTVQLVMGVYGSGESDDICIFDSNKIKYQNTRYVGDVDGYTVTMKPQLAPGIISPKDAGVQLGEDVLSITPVRVNATITAVEQNAFAPYMIEMTFYIESFEPY